MYTDCPSCERRFRIRAAQLGAADGWVTCGNCGETFYALERLHDTPIKHPPVLRETDEVAAEPPAVDIEPEQAHAPVPRIDLPEPEPIESEEAAEPAPEEPEQDQPGEEEAAPEDIEPEQPVETVQQPDEILTPSLESAETETDDTDDTDDTDESRELLPDLPPVLAEDPKKKTGSTAPIIWGSLVIVLAMAAVMQLAWFNRDALLRAYPALAPRVEQICESLQCEPIRFRDVSAIELLNRQVTQHPRYRNALLASATMVNNAEYMQPFPDIELLIFATDGQVISRGRFRPGEYLNPDVSPSSGMPPGVPIHFGLDLDGAAQDAVSFRFRFR